MSELNRLIQKGVQRKASARAATALLPVAIEAFRPALLSPTTAAIAAATIVSTTIVTASITMAIMAIMATDTLMAAMSTVVLLPLTTVTTSIVPSAGATFWFATNTDWLGSPHQSPLTENKLAALTPNK